jgi:two-component system, NarL family, invasion response regulator UvrY
MTKIALIDDHTLIRNALKELINRFEGFEVCLDAANGKEFIDCLKHTSLPDIALVDINMPVMNGYDTATFLHQNFPEIKIIALSVNDDDESIIKMLRCSAVGYLLKDTETQQLQFALKEVVKKGYYHSDLVRNTLMKNLKGEQSVAKRTFNTFQGREEEFLELACSELTYKEIADRMCLSPRTIDGYRENLFIKFDLKSRVGLVLFAIKNGFVKM